MTDFEQPVYPSNRFYLEIDGAMKALFVEVSGLQVETDVLEYAEGGNNGFVHRLPGRTRVSNLTLKRGMIVDSDMFTWYMDIAAGRKIDRRNVSLILYNIDGVEVQRWNFFSAYPVRWIGPQLDATSTAHAIETIELAHAGMQMD